MVEANIIAVFIGIESPNEASLRETKKFQNVRQGGTMLEKVHRIQDAGMEVWCGMIIGFDNDDETIFDAQIEFIQRGPDRHLDDRDALRHPKTPLYDRLAAEGRLDPADRPNSAPTSSRCKIGREELRDGYVKVMTEPLHARGLLRPARRPLHRGWHRHRPGPLAVTGRSTRSSGSRSSRSGWCRPSACSSG